MRWFLVVVGACLATASSTPMDTPVRFSSQSLAVSELKKAVAVAAEEESSSTAVCFITSRSVTRAQRQAVLPNDKLSVLEQGVILMQASTLPEVCVAASAASTLLYYPSSTDLERSEGLFDLLAPAMERCRKTTRLIVLVPTSSTIAQAKAALEQAATPILVNLARNDDEQPVQLLTDVFSQVDYVEASSNVLANLAAPLESSVESDDSEIEASPATPFRDSLSASDLAATRLWAPVAVQQRERALQRVQIAAYGEDGDEDSLQLVPEFGALCDAVVLEAVRPLESSDNVSIQSSAMGQQIRQGLIAELYSELSDQFQDQLELLELSSFEEFKRDLSKLRVSPQLASDLAAAVKKSTTAFGSAARRLVARSVPAASAAAWTMRPAASRFGRRLAEYARDRLLAAQASGQYKPIPRKGVTVGFHWLLPKPFGNDYRQEPWMVHATDDMVYVPTGKISQVNPDQVAAGDWRSKIVPSPIGNDMVYMQ
jgi:hypothetical protein